MKLATSELRQIELIEKSTKRIILSTLALCFLPLLFVVINITCGFDYSIRQCFLDWYNHHKSGEAWGIFDDQ